MVFDLVGNRSFRDCAEALSADGGIYVSTVASPRLFFSVAATTLGSLLGRGQRARLMMVRYRWEDLAILARMAEQGKLRPVIQEVVPLAEIARAHDLSEGGHVRGKVVALVK